MSPVDPAARASLLSASVVLPQHVVYRAFATETVILNLRSGMYHGLNPTGARMLAALERSPIVGDAADLTLDSWLNSYVGSNGYLYGNLCGVNAICWCLLHNVYR